jgi:hypothetical protein
LAVARARTHSPDLPTADEVADETSSTDASLAGSALYQSGSAQDVETFGVPTVISVACSTTSGNSGGTAGVFSGSLTAVNIHTNKGVGVRQGLSSGGIGRHLAPG